MVEAEASCDDPLLYSRRTNLPKTYPWPVDFFQPKEVVEGDKDAHSLPQARSDTIALDALNAAQTLAEESGAQAFLVSRDGTLEAKWFATGTDETTPLHTYHMHYTPVVLLIGILIDEGQIETVDQSASAFITEWQGTEKEVITIRDLLSMHSGLELRFDAHKSEGMYSRDACAYWGARSEDIIISAYPVQAKPGSRFDYNYIVPELLGLIIERASGESYEDVLSSRLWAPLGNRDATVWLNRPGGEAHQDASLFAGAADWLRLGELLADRGGELVSDDFVSKMMNDTRTNPNFAYMWRGSPYQPARRLATDERVTYTVAQGEPFLRDDVFYISGYGGQRVYIVPSEKLVVVRLGAVDRHFDNSAILNAVLRGLPSKDE